MSSRFSHSFGPPGAGSGPGRPGSRLNMGNSQRPLRTGPLQAGPARSASSTTNSRDDLSTHRYVLSEPADVYPFPGTATPKIYPDFDPWRKTRDEDLLVVDCLQRGHHEPLRVSNESGSAKSSMIPLLKQWTSLPALSFFLVNAMEVRERTSRISSNWTFKPPPRVTLTDQKREAWLRDLASPAVPLRRLSRTIPHGIRNRTLLDQCCQKAVPISRAVWFARCVGANELRGLKRKGTSGASAAASEAAWIRDWSEEVMAFVERLVGDLDSISPVTTVDSDDKPVKRSWKTRMEYMTRLTAYLYREQLLDSDVCLKWCLKFLHGSRPDELPMALVFIRMFWNELIENRAYAQSLALALLNQHAKVSDMVAQLNSTHSFSRLFMKLTDYIKELLLISSDSFVIPKSWRSLGPVLIDVTKESDPEFRRLLDAIRIRNESLIVGDAPLARAARNSRCNLIKQLDSLTSPFGFESLTTSLINIRLSPQETMDTLFRWTTTRSRVGQDRVFICLALCLHWKQKLDWNVPDAFLQFLVSVGNPDEFDMSNVYDLVAEFVAYDLVPLGGYFRKLISSGILYVERLQTRAQGQILILKNLPQLQAANDLRNQQSMLLRDLDPSSLSVDPTFIDDRLKFLFDEFQNEDEITNDNPDLTPDEITYLGSLTKSVRIQVCSHIIEVYEAALERGFVPTISQFGVLQRILEELHELRALYHIIWITVSKAFSGRLLYILATSIRNYSREFAAIGHCDELVQMFIARYNAIKSKTKLTMSRGLWELIQFAIGNVDSRPELRAELEQLLKPAVNQSPLEISVMSPVSEAMSSETPRPTEGEILLNRLGIQLDENVSSSSISKYFSLVSNKFMDACKVEGNEPNMRLAMIALVHLRDIDLHVFDDLFTTWLRDQVEPTLSYDSKAFSRVLLFSVVYECVSLQKVADIFMQLKSVRLPGSAVNSRLMILVASCKTLDHVVLKAGERLLLDVHRNIFQTCNSRVYLKYVVQEVLECAGTTGEVDCSWFEWVSDFLLWLSAVDSELFDTGFVEPLLEKKDPKVLGILRQVLNRLLQITQASTPMTVADPKNDIFELMKVSNDINLSLCQVQLRVVLESLRLEREDFMDFSVETILDVCSEAATHGVPKSVFGDILLHLEKDIKGELLYKCELAFLKSPQFPRVVLNMQQNMVGPLLEIVDAIADSSTKDIGVSHVFDLESCLDKLISVSDKAKETKSDAPETPNVEAEMEPQSKDDIHDAVMLFVKIAMIHFQSSGSLSQQGAVLREKIVQGFLILRETALIKSLDDLSGLLLDALNCIREEQGSAKSANASTVAVNTGGGTRSTPATPVRAVANVPAAVHIPDDTSAAPYYLSDLMLYDRSSEIYTDLKVRTFDLLEEGNASMSINDTPINLSMFDSAIDRKNAH